MKQTLLLLFLTSLCSLSVGHKRVYHFINERITWLEAVEFCRKHYTDLATVDEQNDASSVCPRDQGCNDAWVRNYTQQCTGEWKWTDGKLYIPSKANWKENSQHNEGNCATVKYHQNGDEELSWYNRSCGNKTRFICYNGKNNYESQNDEKTFEKAQSICKENKMNLVTGHDQVESEEFKNTIKTMGQDIFWWIGLFRAQESGDKLCKCTKLGQGDTLENDNCDDTHPFICYDDHMVLVEQTKTFEEALIYCRKNYCDLATMTDEHQQTMVLKKAQMAKTPFVWVGLTFACFFEEWMWVSGHWVSFDHENWENPKERRHGCDVAGAMQRSGSDKWFKERIEKQYNFICSIHC